ncbi:MAG: carboxypeptidase regulatory-like domain-containing protein, partial [Planctomycetota bacterium JB042]
MTAAATRAWPPLLAVLLVVGLATALLLLRGPSPEDARATVEEATPESAADGRPIEPPPPAAVPRAERRALPTDEAASADRLDADARPGYPVEFHGRVVRAEDGRPIADAAVEIHGWDRTTRTDADGRFSLTLAWTRALLVRAPGRAPRIVEGDDAHAPPAPPLEVRLGLGGTVRLAFDDRRAAIGERSLVARVDRSVAWTDPGGLVTPPERWGEAAFHAPLDARGWASLPDLPTGVPLILTVDEEGRPLHAVERGLVLAPGEVVRFERRLGGPTVVAGTVVSARDGRPLPEQVVLLFDASRRGEGDVGDRRYATVADRLHYGSRDSGTPAVLRSTADANGRFRWTDVAPGRYEIGAGAGNPLPTVSLDIAPGTPIAEVTVPVPDLEIRGTVLSPEGTPNPHSIVSAIPTNEPQVIHSRTDAHGRFRIAPVWPGRFRIRAWAPHRGGGPAEVEVEAGATDVVLRLPAGASVSGTVRDAKTGAGIR